MLWIGGPPASGKTAIATRLARRHGLRWYNADWRTWEHRDRAIRARNPAAIRWEALSPEARWAAPLEEQVEMSLHFERGPMVVEDLERLPRSPLIVAEGSTISPSLTPDRSRSVWLLPTTDFQKAQFDERRLPPGPRRLYRRLAAVIEREARGSGVPALIVDGSRPLDEMTASVEELFAEAIAAGPRAQTGDERRTLLREANEAIAAQVRGYYARPWAEGDAETVDREFLCECGEPGCEATIRTAVGASRQPLLALGHEGRDRRTRSVAD